MQRLRSLVNQYPTLRKGALRLRSLAKLTKSRGDIFTEYYQNHKWFDGESHSGAGSSLAYTENARRMLPVLWETYNISRFLDAPCGDFHWFQHIELPEGFEYIGADIVAPLIEHNRAHFANEQRQFMKLDICKDSLPKVDMWMSRDCWFHLREDEIFQAIRSFLKSEIPYLLTTTHFACEENRDILTGGFRLLNLEKAPFLFPHPIDTIDDWIEGYPPRRLALWKREQLLHLV